MVSALVFVSVGPDFGPAGVILIRSCVSLSQCLTPPTEV